jgi:hypothetical protein
MQKVIVLNNQSLLDLAIQETGIAMNYIKIADANNISPTELIAPGTNLIIHETLEVNTDVVRYYKANSIVPATDTGKIESIEFAGIGSMKIDETFVVR